MEKIVLANLKMNFTNEEVMDYIKAIDAGLESKSVVITPSSLYLPYFLGKNYSVGIQNIYFEDMGAYTGECSPKQASSLGVEYALIGHSERRIKIKENVQEYAKKISAAIRNDIIPVLCIGETLEAKEAGETLKILDGQITGAIASLSEEDVKKVLIAYEPVWSISTFTDNPLVATTDDIASAISNIKGIVKNLYPDIDVPVLYGGSVNASNITEINAVPDISGVLVGGASLKAEEIIKIKEVMLG